MNHKQVTSFKVSLLGRIVYYLLPYRKKTIQKNIELVYQQSLSAIEKKRLVQAFYTHLLKCIKEYLILPWMSQEQSQKKVHLKGDEQVVQALTQKKGVILLTGHLGNWELGVQALGLPQLKPFQFHVIRKPIGTQWIEKMIHHRMKKSRVHVINSRASLFLLDVRHALEKNEIVIFTLDQYVGTAKKRGIDVEFFGKKTGTYVSLAHFVNHTATPVIPCATYRMENNVHVLECHPPLPWQSCASLKETLYQNTLIYNQALEKLILAHPEQWLWSHKRWR